MNYDWQTITLMIRAHYRNLSDLAKEIGSDWQHLNRLARGGTKEPKFSVGMNLLDIYNKHCAHKCKQSIRLGW